MERVEQRDSALEFRCPEFKTRRALRSRIVDRNREARQRFVRLHAGLRLFFKNLALLLRISRIFQLYFARVRSKYANSENRITANSMTYEIGFVRRITLIDATGEIMPPWG